MKLEPGAGVCIQGETDETAPMRRHEVDRFRRNLVRSKREVTLVLAVFIVDDDENLPLAEIFDRFGPM